MTLGGIGWPSVVFLTLSALAAGFIDAIAGGGGLLTLPALLAAGLNPVAAVATNKLQGSFGSGSATLAYARAGHLEARPVAPMMAASCAGSLLGALSLSHLPAQAVEKALPLALVAVALYFALSPSLSDRNARQRLPAAVFTFFLAPAIGCYDGFFGPGAGSFFMFAFIELLGFAVVRAAAHTRAVNFASNLAALAVFSLSGEVVWTIGLLMGCAQFLGASLGARATMRNGARLVRPLLALVCTAMAIRLAATAWR